jgi:hypothetical protein
VPFTPAFERWAPRNPLTIGRRKTSDYGETILGPAPTVLSRAPIRRFIPTLLNETSEGAHHIVLTQNALADQSYLDYIGFLHGDKLGTLTKKIHNAPFRSYRGRPKRLEHDRQFPDEPKQIRPGEDVHPSTARFRSVVDRHGHQRKAHANDSPAIRPLLCPHRIVPVQPLADAAPLGAIMELASETSKRADPERAGRCHWLRTTAQQLPPIRSHRFLMKWARPPKMVASGGLFQEHDPPPKPKRPSHRVGPVPV